MNRTIEDHPTSPDSILLVDWDAGLAFDFSRQYIDRGTVAWIAESTDDLTDEFSPSEEAYAAIYAVKNEDPLAKAERELKIATDEANAAEARRVDTINRVMRLRHDRQATEA